MTKKILLLHSSVDGHTVKILDKISSLIGKKRNITKKCISDVSRDLIKQSDSVIIGASIRYGDHRKNLYDFVDQNKDLLDEKDNAFFSVNAVARKDDKNTANTNPYITKFLRKSKWKPKKIEVFAGRIDYPKYNAFDKYMIRFIMWMSKGPTDPSKVFELTDWKKVESFGKKVLNDFLKT